MVVWELSNSFSTLMQGFMLYISLIIAVGPQNLFILRQGMRGRHLFTTATLSTLADLILISVGVGGMGVVFANNSFLLTAATLGGVTFLCGYAVCSLRSIWRCPHVTSPTLSPTGAIGVPGIIAASLSFSFLNPAAYIDTVLMVGTTSSHYPLDERFLFGAGAVIASGVWFFTLIYGASRLAPLLSRPVAWRILDVISGCIMLGIAVALYYR